MADESNGGDLEGIPQETDLAVETTTTTTDADSTANDGGDVDVEQIVEDKKEDTAKNGEHDEIEKAAENDPSAKEDKPTHEINDESDPNADQTDQPVITPPATEEETKTELTQEVLEEQKEDIMEEEEEDEGGLANDFYYDNKGSAGVPMDVLELDRSFGYACRNPSNLFVIDINIVFYAAGDFVIFHNLETGHQSFLRSLSGCGIGALALHPSKKFFAVGEKGDNPQINLYEYPSMKLYRILREGTTKEYAALAFNGKGDKLASVGAYPDFMLTVWVWKKEGVILRTKAFSSDIWRVTFAALNDGQLTTGGIGHIRFWKMADTFTGLKLQGDIGKFGKAEISDITGYVELPDGKVVSGSEWGNMLLWEGGKIKCEIARKGKHPCHMGSLEVVMLEDAELITAGSDGHIRVWNLDEIDLADAPDEHNMVYEMDPMMDRKVSAFAHIKSLSKSDEVDADDNASIWYVQDGNGAIWKADLSPSLKAKAPKALVEFHAGGINGVDVCGVAHVAATVGEDGAVMLYDYVAKKYLEKFVTEHVAGTCVMWAPLKMDPSGSTIYAGFADGVLRQFRCAVATTGGAKASQLVLAQVWKPHSHPIQTIVTSCDGSILVTADKRSLFFFAVNNDSLDPIGFYKLDENVGDISCVRYVTNDAGIDQLLVGRQDGVLMEFDSPKSFDYDTKRTYELTTPQPFKPHRAYTFKSMAAKIEAIKIAAQAQADKAKKKKPAKAEGDDKKEEEEENDEESDETVATKSNTKEQPPSAILDAWFSSHGTFYLILSGKDAGYIFECSFDMEEPSMWFPMPGESNVECTKAVVARDGNAVVLLGNDGTVRVHETGDLSRSKQTQLHDRTAGRITGAVESFDGAYMVTSGDDGNMFVLRAAFNGEVKEIKKSSELPTLDPMMKSVSDIVDPKAYTIEEIKQKSEREAKEKTADEKKADVRQQIRILRREFEKTIKSNNELAPKQRLEKDFFVLDPTYAAKVRAAQAAERALYSAEMNWTIERHRVGYEKLRKRFLKRVLDPLFVVRAIRTHEMVSTFRLNDTSAEFKKIANMMFYPLVKLKGWAERAKRAVKARNKANADDQDEKDREDSDALMTIDLGATGGANMTPLGKSRSLSRAETKLMQTQNRLKEREERKRLMAEILADKPDENAINPEDLKELELAKLNIGNYKLKTAKDFTLAKDDRVTSQSKRSQIISLRQRIYDAKGTFNAYVRKVRDAKVQAIEDVRLSRELLLKVKMRLGEPLRVPTVPTLFDDETPERTMEVTPETLERFKQELIEDQIREQAAKEAARSAGGFGGLGDDDEEQEEQEDDDDAAAGGGGDGTTVYAWGNDEDVEGVSISAGDVEGQRQIWRPQVYQSIGKAQRKQLEHQRDLLNNKIHSIVDDFDKSVRILLQAKRECEVRIKFAEHQHVVFYRELVHLKAFDKRENFIEERLATKKAERDNSIAKAKEKGDKFLQKRDTVKLLDKTIKDLQHDFISALGENNKQEKYLTKVYKKKLKRKKPGEEEDSDSDSSSEDEDSDVDSDDDEDFDDTVAPPGCSAELFEKILELRGRRCDAEDGLVEARKECDILKKERDAMVKRETALNTAVKNEEQDLEALQLEKQAKLNEIGTAVPLKLSQIQHLTKRAAVPVDFSDSLVFSVDEIGKLKRRIDELAEEKELQKSEKKAIRHMQSKLSSQKKEKEKITQELKQKCDEIMMLKFGTIIDLDQIEGHEMNHAGTELKAQLRRLEAEAARQMKKWDEALFQTKLTYDRMVQQNTEYTSKIVNLNKTRSSLAVALDKAQAKDVHEESAERVMRTKAERIRLAELAKAQAKEIEELKYEIGMLTHKGGSIRPPQKQTSSLPPI
eukprot:m.184465 g.184465  ORF g.184465 m.184465 type:complete len:1849 (+) comp32191_c0_seq1:110-5656(+)